jgi:hypothetical protein
MLSKREETLVSSGKRENTTVIEYQHKPHRDPSALIRRASRTQNLAHTVRDSFNRKFWTRRKLASTP